jgi:uncharacterized membrane protein
MKAAAEGYFGTSRIEAFSDGVLAIVITLLVLEIKIPELDSPGSSSEAWAALRDLFPKFAGFFLSFLFIAVFWVNHHRFFALVTRVDWGLLWLNNLLLLFLCFVPFPTAFVGNHPGNPVAIALFASVLMLSGVAFNIMWRYVRQRGFIEVEVRGKRVHKAIRRGLIGPIAYMISGVAGFFESQISWLIFFAVPVLYALPDQMEKRSKEE